MLEDNESPWFTRGFWWAAVRSESFRSALLLDREIPEQHQDSPGRKRNEDRRRD
jgi:hypothetical protein